MALALAGCTRTGSDRAVAASPLQAGVWRGDVAPAGSRPFGALFHVVESEAGPTIRLASQYMHATFTNVAVAADSLRFTWPLERPRHCRLRLRADGGWQGACHRQGTEPIELVMLPPAHPDSPTGLARAAYESDVPWIEERVGQLRILIQDGGAAEHATSLQEGAVAALESAFAILGETPPDTPFWVIYIDSREVMRQLTGWPAGGWADGVARTAASTVTVDGRAPDRHELTHVAATVAWGIPAEPWEWVNEGLATYAPGECGGADIHSLGSELVEQGAAVPLRNLVHDFRGLDEVAAYLQSASVVGYIRETFGITALRSIWRDGPAAIPVVTGMDMDSLEGKWRAFLSRVPAASALQSVRAHGCL